MYHKDFDQWNELKKRTHTNDSYLPLYHERQVRWCRLGVNVGFEQDGTGSDFSRPVLILRGFSRHVCLVVPLTTATKENKYHVSIGIIAGKEAFAISLKSDSLIQSGLTSISLPLTRRHSGAYEMPSENYSDGISFFLPLAGAGPKAFVAVG